tara:strand:+ start:247 stop:417 length:171 start_codon:yes stop_codon:yes gene_type:complete
MDKRGFTTESGGRQNGFSIEPEINIITEGESKKSLLLFFVLISVILGILIYFFQNK